MLILKAQLKNLFLASIAIYVVFSVSFFSRQGNSTFNQKTILKSPEARAILLHYEAIKLFQEGKINKAKRKLIKALRLHKTNEYLIDLASIYEAKGEYKKAFHTLLKLVPYDKQNPLAEVKLIANKAVYAMHLGLELEAHETFGHALRRYKMYKLDSSQLKSVLLNNYAVSKFFYQTIPPHDTLMNVHIRDLIKAREFIQKAVNIDSGNCIAQYNLAFIDSLLNGIDWKLVKNRPPYYFRPHNVFGIRFPDLDCPIPVREFRENIVEYLNREREIVFIMDISGSMESVATNGKTRIDMMKTLAIDLLSELNEDVQVGLLTVGQNCSSPPLKKINTQEGYSREELSEIITNLHLDGCTPLNIRIKEAEQLFSRKRKKGKAIFLFSDGINFCCDRQNEPEENTCKIAQHLEKKGIKIYVFSMLLEEKKNYGEYAIYDCMIKATHGELFGITEQGYSIKTAFMDAPLYSLPLKREDVVNGYYTFPDLSKERLVHSNQ